MNFCLKLTFSILLAHSGNLLAHEPSRVVDFSKSELKISSLNFRLFDQQGVSHALGYFSDQNKIFLSTFEIGDKSTFEFLKFIEANKQYFKKNKNKFLFINANLNTLREEIQKALADYEISVLMDVSQTVSKSFNFKASGEVLVINPQNWRVLHKGTLGGIFCDTKLKFWSSQTNHPVPSPNTCKKMNQTPIPIIYKNFSNVTYTNNVARVFYKRCVACHMRYDNMDYFKTYADILGWKDMISQTMRLYRMPPGGVDYMHGNLRHIITEKDLRLIQAWAAEGMIRGEGADPLPRMRAQRLKVTQQRSKNLPKPDYIFKMSKPDIIPASGHVDYKYVQLSPAMEKDTYFEAIDYDFNLSVVHHSNLWVVPKPIDIDTWNVSESHSNDTVEIFLKRLYNDRADILENIAPDGRGKNYLIDENILTTYSRRKGLHKARPGTAFFVPKGHYIISEFHYQPSGKKEINTATLKLFKYREDKPPKKLKRMGMWRSTFKIPPKEKKFVVRSSAKIQKDFTIYRMTLHMHYRGVSGKIFVKYPTSSNPKIVLSVPFHQFKFQLPYEPIVPIPVPKGSTLITELVYDNSEQNLANPDSSVWVTNGLMTFANEMHLPRIFYWDGI